MQTRLDLNQEQDTAPGWADSMIPWFQEGWSSGSSPVSSPRMGPVTLPGEVCRKAPILLFYSRGKIGMLLIHVMNIHLID